MENGESLKTRLKGAVSHLGVASRDSFKIVQTVLISIILSLKNSEKGSEIVRFYSRFHYSELEVWKAGEKAIACRV